MCHCLLRFTSSGRLFIIFILSTGQSTLRFCGINFVVENVRFTAYFACGIYLETRTNVNGDDVCLHDKHFVSINTSSRTREIVESKVHRLKKQRRWCLSAGEVNVKDCVSCGEWVCVMCVCECTTCVDLSLQRNKISQETYKLVYSPLTGWRVCLKMDALKIRTLSLNAEKHIKKTFARAHKNCVNFFE